MHIACRIWMLFLTLALSGCYRNNFPIDLAFAPELVRPATIRVSVDADGTFFPDCWHSFVSPGKKWPGRSLLGTTTDPLPVGSDCRDATTPLRDRIASARKAQLSAIGKQMSAATRVFVFVHGYNNSHAEADAGYDQLERVIDFRAGDLVIRFYWDGYVAGSSFTGAGSPAYFWFKAVKNSQLAGMYGLRPILALANHQQVIVISHSRGASVILSALSNPTFGTEWQARWAERISRLSNQLEPPELINAGGPIDAVMLAPAIGTLDFCKPGTDIKHPCDTARNFPKRFRSLSFTRNPNDPVLKKFVGLAHRMYPTSLGSLTKRDIGPWVARALPDRPVTRVDLTNQYVHRFDCYAANPALPQLLGQLPQKVDARPGYRASIAQRAECEWHDATLNDPVKL